MVFENPCVGPYERGISSSQWSLIKNEIKAITDPYKLYYSTFTEKVNVSLTMKTTGVVYPCAAGASLVPSRRSGRTTAVCLLGEHFPNTDGTTDRHCEWRIPGSLDGSRSPWRRQLPAVGRGSGRETAMFVCSTSCCALP